MYIERWEEGEKIERQADGQMDRQIDRQIDRERKRLASYPFKMLVSPESRDDQSEQTPSESYTI